MTPLRTWLWIILLAVGVGAVLPVPAFSQPYVRLGVTLDWTKDTRFQDADCSASGNLYGCGAGNDGAPKSSLGDFGTMTGLELGLGYTFLLLRLEVALQYRPDFAFEGHANFSQLELTDRREVSADASAWSGMLTTYLDVPFPNFGLLWLVPVRTFAGVGLGLSRIEISETRMDFPTTTTIVPGGRQTSFSWLLSAGLSVSLTRWLAVDLAWRYTDYGAVETAGGEGQVIWRDGSQNPLDLDLQKTIGDLRGHGLIASLRYSF